ncbi:MAG TPA: serine hydrolase domain-containing protein [Acidobacteriota bacterium]|jgi:CubicO group peptidase (beta-lactamase class C family)|nr:serine hydrolase domain-containing protein [Acidobacteriota bacterium]|tara:strand:- start:2280 stop:3653 length:1374 start_codon:yes stop_codon:yes gene_type:complete
MEKEGLILHQEGSKRNRVNLARTATTIIAVVVQIGFALPSKTHQLPLAEPESVNMSSEGLELLGTTMQSYIDSKMVAGTVSLVARQGKVIHLKAQGYRHIEENAAMTGDTIFVIMSMTKPIVSTALMMLFEEGYFLLDDPISKYLPEFANKSVAVRTEDGVERVPSKHPITFRHVLTHTAGIDPSPRVISREERSLLRPRPTLEETLVARAPLPLAFHPGDRWSYGSSTDYVALLVERVSGQRLDQFLQQRVFGPLGMVDTFYNVPASKVDRVSAVYSPSGPGSTIQLRVAPEIQPPTSYFGGVAGLSSTAADYFRFAQMILNEGELDGVRLLRPSTVKLMITNHTGDMPVYGMGGAGFGFGLGFSMLTDPTRSREGLTEGTFGWLGIWGTSFWIDPAEELISILMMQITSYRHFNIRQDFARLAINAITESFKLGLQDIRAYTSIERYATSERGRP